MSLMVSRIEVREGRMGSPVMVVSQYLRFCIIIREDVAK